MILSCMKSRLTLTYLRLRSDSSSSPVVRRTRLSTVGNRAFPVAALFPTVTPKDSSLQTFFLPIPCRARAVISAAETWWTLLGALVVTPPRYGWHLTNCRITNNIRHFGHQDIIDLFILLTYCNSYVYHKHWSLLRQLMGVGHWLKLIKHLMHSVQKAADNVLQYYTTDCTWK